ncbi:hypothetical protein PO883_33455, partial [Massilia sp. DJPM01]|uniref:hypothetical protein n=1 Tax=Massilia sp. DJPM01 TaxID=3024404 RepID=UPI00259EB651
LIVKELILYFHLAAWYEALCSLQQRGEIMQRFAFLVNLFLLLRFFQNAPDLSCNYLISLLNQRGGEL